VPAMTPCGQELIVWSRGFCVTFRMSLHGTKRTCRLHCSMSALRGKAENINSDHSRSRSADNYNDPWLHGLARASVSVP
jgi:hypothetical protein